jgi:hypothetical protein
MPGQRIGHPPCSIDFITQLATTAVLPTIISTPTPQFLRDAEAAHTNEIGGKLRRSLRQGSSQYDYPWLVTRKGMRGAIAARLSGQDGHTLARPLCQCGFLARRKAEGSTGGAATTSVAPIPVSYLSPRAPAAPSLYSSGVLIIYSCDANQGGWVRYFFCAGMNFFQRSMGM